MVGCKAVAGSISCALSALALHVSQREAASLECFVKKVVQKVCSKDVEKQTL